jgi:hypothetical protein
MNLIQKPKFLTALLCLIFAFGLTSTSFAQDDGSQFADESYSEEEAEAAAAANEADEASASGESDGEEMMDEQAVDSDNWSKESWDEQESEEDDETP